MVVFDLDGTLSIVGDRIKYLNRSPKDWDAFYEHCGEDKVFSEIAEVYRVFYDAALEVKVVTGRQESVRGITLDWLASNDIWLSAGDLHMRANGDFRHDTIVKPEIIEPFKDKIELIFENRTSMVQKWRELGYVCVQVAPGDF